MNMINFSSCLKETVEVGGEGVSSIRKIYVPLPRVDQGTLYSLNELHTLVLCFMCN